MSGQLIYGLCALTAAACAVCLIAGFLRTRSYLLMWSGACFVGLTADNVMLILDRLVFTAIDLSTLRLAIALASVILLLCGLILEGKS